MVEVDEDNSASVTYLSSAMSRRQQKHSHADFSIEKEVEGESIRSRRPDIGIFEEGVN